MEQNNKQTSFWALSPLIVFVALFIGTGITTKNFEFLPLNVAILIAAIFACMMYPKTSLVKKLDIFTKGAGHPNILLMVFVFLLAGAFSETAKGMGAVSSTVNLSLSLIPGPFLLSGLFIVGAFISVAMGTSMGTVAALAPVGVGIAEATNISLTLTIATVVGGAMFGDNLSMISDTTIAAVRTQKTKMSDKFKMNFLIVLPGALITVIILWLITKDMGMTDASQGGYSIIKVIPYLFVLIAALSGMNVLMVLVFGTLIASVIGLSDGSYSIAENLKAISDGMIGMQDISMVALFIGGMIGIIEYFGGIRWLLNTLTRRVKSKRGAEFGIASLVSLTNLATANNTIAIITAGPLAKEISEDYDIDSRKSASILDIFASTVQGIIPYGAQVLAATSVAGISTVSLLPYSFYPYLLGICGIVSILIGYPKSNKTKKM
ncbi:Na+/H+ antiporter NhaC family protein [Mammaliicoccus stepanovicii]|uniref:Putative transport protein n=1 Tax=Mammaliicoccus stepanovicii TaxID=643214 RepID=A0A239YIY6_9STAP|nr:Na+/H+ antiporter NhaC family protein [Mammaliicoccus stepanovicii]PNZ74694.1 sodium:proton antiporter [Mammaliicoccus stepanovicii]GGI40837.1 sodium:proton antiporter [Mammaliicoccus stepanovicii]SNV58198.1 putative transport protein [Mammaliicoccus stepanovicii]